MTVDTARNYPIKVLQWVGVRPGAHVRGVGARRYLRRVISPTLTNKDLLCVSARPLRFAFGLNCGRWLSSEMRAAVLCWLLCLGPVCCLAAQQVCDGMLQEVSRK